VLITPEALVPIANAFCAAARSCCLKDGILPALDNCESQYGYGSTAQALTKGTVTVDSPGLASCLAAYQAASETCEAAPVIAACRGLVHGTLAEGQPCRFHSECAGVEPMVCLLPDEHGAGVCKKIVHAKAGDACVIHCRPDSSICSLISYAPAGAAAMGCFEAEGVYCDRSTNSPTCSPVRATGAACTNSEQCGSARSECDVKTRKCKLFTLVPQRFSSGGVCGGGSYGP
jgi:hypothetical protein